MCRSHYDAARRAGALQPLYVRRKPQCSRPDCGRIVKARGLCAIHYNAERERAGRECAVMDCPRPALSRGWCRQHYRRWRTYGDPEATPVWADLVHDVPEGMRLCRTCRQLCPVEDFRVRVKRAGGPRDSKCRSCKAEAWQRKREHHLARKAARNFGITPEQYAELMSGGCHVCGITSHASGRRLHIDHCHATGKVRGALCHGCNTALGLALDSAERLRALAAYVERHA